jgi:hypothetical protein
VTYFVQPSGSKGDVDARESQEGCIATGGLAFVLLSSNLVLHPASILRRCDLRVVDETFESSFELRRLMDLEKEEMLESLGQSRP